MCSQKNSLNRKKLYLFVLVATITGVLVVPGCSPTSSTNSNFSSNTASRLENASNEIDRSADQIFTSTEKIEDETKEIESDAKEIETASQIPEVRENAQIIQSKTSQILSELNTIKQQTEDIKAQNNTIKGTANAVQGLEDNIEEYENEGTAEAKKKLYNLILGMSAFGGISIIGGIILFFFNPKLGAMVAAFGLITSVISIAGVYYLKWIAIWGISLLGLALVITVGFLIRSFLQAKNYKISHEKNIELIEEIKDTLPETKRKEIFDDGGLADQIQPEAVKKLVKKTKLSKKLNT